MADVSITLLTPISIRLSWTGGAGDYEVWWKSSHPAGQEYVPLATVTGTSYDVGALSWTMTYYFKVRQVGGAFGDSVEVFVCCGQAVVIGGPPLAGGPPTTVHALDFWQQSADPCGDKIALSFISNDRYYIYLFLYEDGEWKYIGRKFLTESGHPYDPAWYQTTTGHFPPATRMVGDKIAVFSTLEFDGYYGWYEYSLRNSSADDFYPGGDITSFNTGPNPWTNYYDETYFRERWLQSKSAPYSMELNGSGRVVTLQAYIDYSNAGYDWELDDWPYKLTLRESNDFGNSFGDEIEVHRTIQYDWDNPFGATMTEDGNGVIWIALQTTDDPEGRVPAYIYRDLGIKALYKIFKYENGVVSFVRDITTELLNTWQTVSPWYQISWDYSAANCVLYAEGLMIVACYTHDYTQVQVEALGCDYGYWAKYQVHAAVAATCTVFVDISNDGGSSWVKKEVSFGETIYVHPEYDETIPTVCIANGVILVYLLVGNGTEQPEVSVGRRIVRSMDNGDTWSVVCDFTGIPPFRLPWVATIRADGNHVVLTGCIFTKTDYLGEPPLAIWQSLDAGATWAVLEVIPTPQPLILAPA
jgi:hypothetical protein